MIPKKIYLISVITFLIDFISKKLAINYLNKDIEIIEGFFYLSLHKNEGAAFSSFNNQRLFLIIITIIILCFLYKMLKSEKFNIIKIISYSFLLGGIIGNLIDRLVYGYVIDFLSFYPFNYPFPIFNFADTFIVIGAIFLIIEIIRSEKYEN